MNHRVGISVGHYLGEPTREYEYPANQRVAVLLHSILTVNGYQAEIFSGELPTKVKDINDYNADIALDVHFNRLAWPHNPTKFGSGYEVCVWEGSVYGKLIATQILQAFSERIPFERRGKGVWERKDLYFLKHTKCPAVTPEPLFLDNPFEEPFLKTKRGYEFIATALYLGINGYFAERNSN